MDAPYSRQSARSEVPAADTDAERLRSLIAYAVLAPSDRNTQPWTFAVSGETLDLLADRSRLMPHGDPDGRTLAISCGAALYYLRLAARHFGFAAQVDRLPDRAAPDLLARIRLVPAPAPTRAEERLFDAIPDRHTNRRPFRHGFVPPYLLTQLARAAEAEGAWLTVVENADHREALAELVAEGDRLRMEDPDVREERIGWIRPATSPSQDGLPGYALGLPAPLDFATGLLASLLRHDEHGRGLAFVETTLATGPGVLAILGTAHDAPANHLRAGEALARVLLRATAAGLSASFLNAPIEVPALRSRVATYAGRAGWPQLLLRLGYGPDVPPTPRRPAGDVTAS